MTGKTRPGTGNKNKKKDLETEHSRLFCLKNKTQRRVFFLFSYCSEVLFGEYNCTGKGADRTGRVPWSKSLTQDDAKPFLGMKFISGDKWLRLKTSDNKNSQWSI